MKHSVTLVHFHLNQHLLISLVFFSMAICLTIQVLPEDGITVFANILHTHVAGG